MMWIGSLSIFGPAVLAPMSGITQWPMRLLCRERGAALVFTEMISAEALLRGQGKERLLTMSLLRSRPQERPLGVQLFGAEPRVMAAAAALVAELDADLLDINMGCPAGKIVRSGAGAALMKDLPRAARVIREVRKAVSLPLTVKMRSGWDAGSINAPELSRLAEAEGADAVIVHARTRHQGFSGPADWSVIRKTVEAVSIPVIGNGDVFSAEDAQRMMESTGCQAVMIGRGALGNPWIFSRLLDPQSPPPSLEQRHAVIRQHYRWMEELLGGPKAAVQMRKHICWYVKGLPAASELRGKINRAAECPDALQMVDEYFAQLLRA